MFRLLVVVCVRAILVLAGISVAVMINSSSRVQPGNLLHLTDCHLPCWIGIVPGETTLRAANALIQQTYAAFDVRSVERTGVALMQIYVDGKVALTITLYYEARSQIIDQIMLADNITRYGDLLLSLGAPDEIVISPPRARLNPVLLYERLHVRAGWGKTQQVKRECASLSPDQAIAGLTIYQTMPARALPGAEVYEWHGFEGCYP